MNVYAEAGSNAQQVGGECPEGWIVMISQRPDDSDTQLYTAQPDGTWLITQAAHDAVSKVVEDGWRLIELVNIDNQLDALEEAEAGEPPEDLWPGARTQWLSYRGKVRNWVEGKGHFPDTSKRPVRPD